MLKETIKNFVGRLFSSPVRGPERLSRDKHGIDRRNVSRHAIKVCEVLRQKGYDAYIVGGAVRDLIVGLEPKDFDVATNATPEQIRPLFRRARIIGRRFQLVHVVFGQEIIETSTFRAPAEAGDQETDEHGRILRDNLFGTHEQDAARRDFTLNALYYDPIDEVVIDYHRGVADLKKRVVRMIGDPETRYREDPVRMLRAVRFACKLDGTVDPATLEPIRKLAPLVKNVPASRLFDEMLKLLTCGHAMSCLRQLRELGLHQGMLPIIDTLFQTPEGEQFVSLALERTDARVRSGKSVSPSFLFAALLWKLVDKRWVDITAKGEHPIQALVLAADDVIDRQTRTLAIQRRFQADMREIWFMQPRFERATPRTIWRMLDHQRFRAAVDFLQLRAEAREVDSVQAQWWMDLANADSNDRAQMIDEYQRQNAGSASSKPRKRRRRRKPAAASPDGTPA
ncbi:polynucleotide adenylyltransferase PcnB [Pusillimonas noertemannii]|uniref:Poly(A) polymerase I n=1 Tax=Pusillimonas noertemannii TaxID=305977 RepID=A0A2U1CKR0_9BURK|nr:polynucleotide adenylyltransferase PcnB [Pusillimonas noertemannii]NYT69110.1 polynucleotide adenylyltransferase PcnB [Pusillimonas noertemannii]PVY61578.1 poly(A) polymerase [Pusillimonas noertemannii]TFL09525.1 polynucleotide adenylyltransferase PcnB [Pusillimonas noertemannii]